LRQLQTFSLKIGGKTARKRKKKTFFDLLLTSACGDYLLHRQ